MKQKNTLNFFMVSLLFLLSINLTAQTIKGKVVDETGEGIPFMNVIEKGTSNGVTTDDNGKFVINVKKMPTILVISSIGYKQIEQKVTNTNFLVIKVKESSEALDEVVLVGSRNKSRTAIDTPVPVDVIDIKELASAGPQVNLNQILNYVAPSFSSNTQTISDGTDHVDPASLRGLGPDQVLVLINGKRRHTSSLVNVNGTFGRGSVGTDLNAIPTAAIKRIEVLRDGAAAQYGSDAIAGVINIVLNDVTDQLNLSVTSGANISKNSNGQTGGIDGETVNVAANYGIKLGDNGGFINFTGDFDYRNPYSRMKEFEGKIFNAYNSIEWVASHSGMDLANLSLSDIRFAAQGVTHFDLATKTAIANAATLSDLQSLLSFDTTDNELVTRGLKRDDFNMRVGQSQVRSGRFFANMSFPIDDNGTEFYSFAGISNRRGNSAGFYRLPYQNRTYTPLYINGFLPEINSTIKDQSLAVGIKGKVGNWDVDLSNTYGKNSFLFEISNTSNASLLDASPVRFDAGGFSFMQNTTNLDFTNNYKDIFNGLNVAFGAEHRLEVYNIYAGEEASYTSYDVNGLPVTPLTSATTDFFGNPRPGGAQVFPGFSPKNELERQRSSFGAYADIEADFSDEFMIGVAGRFENYSDFGSTFNYKIASRYKITDDFNVRAAVSTGFRAPSLQQIYFNSVSTLFDDNGVPFEVGTFSNDSDIAKQIGIEKLKEEQSASVSFGFTANLPDANLKITADGYFIAIEDRIVLTNKFSIPAGIVTSAEAAAFFANAVDTESKGLDIVLTHKYEFGSDAVLKTDLSATFSQTKRVDDLHIPVKLVGQESAFFGEASRVYLEEAVPSTKINLTNSIALGRFNFFLRNVYFGKVKEANNVPWRQQVFGTKVVTDLAIGFKATDELTFSFGANNLFDIYPDRAATLLKNPNNVTETGNNRSSGRFDWSRRAQQFGIGGRFLFARLKFVIK